MLDESKLRQEIGDLVQGKVSLDDFEDRFVAESWNMHQDSSSPVIKLASSVELLLAEHSSEHLSFEDLKSGLVDLVSVIVASVNEPKRDAAAVGSSTVFRSWDWQLTDSSFDMLREAGHVS